MLRGLDATIRPGEMVAFVGSVGAGKTTLLGLLPRFHNPTCGALRLDGIDTRAVRVADLRRHIALVLQDSILLPATIAENIASGDDSPDRRRIEEVARMADAHGFIGRMPLGYDQVVGERGMGLSGGQIQRLCIARALYHDPRLLVFDEATSALDTQSESNIIANMLLGREQKG